MRKHGLDLGQIQLKGFKKPRNLKMSKKKVVILLQN